MRLEEIKQDIDKLRLELINVKEQLRTQANNVATIGALIDKIQHVVANIKQEQTEYISKDEQYKAIETLKDDVETLRVKLNDTVRVIKRA